MKNLPEMTGETFFTFNVVVTGTGWQTLEGVAPINNNSNYQVDSCKYGLFITR